MANIYYSYSDNRAGVLRAVVSSEDGRWLLKAHSAKYAGQQFPASENSEANFAVLRIFPEEESEEIHSGFYLLCGDIGKIDATVDFCDAARRKKDVGPRGRTLDTGTMH